MSWAEIKSAVNSTVGTGSFKPLNELVAAMTGSIEATANTINARVAAVETSLNSAPVIANGSAVKSVQRGIAQFQAGNTLLTVSIAPVTPEKCIVSLEGTPVHIMGASPYTLNGMVEGLTGTTLSLRIGYAPSGGSVSYYSFSWQIVEFY